jgi:ribonuclease Z
MAMKVTFLGVGEACDERMPNTSVWVETEADHQRRSVMLDCGFTVPSNYWKRTSDPQDLDALWISHFHGDHFFGVPALLLRFWEQKRSKPLALVGQAGLEQTVTQVMELAYPQFLPKLTYPIEFYEIEPGEKVHLAGLDWSTAASLHGQRNLAVRIEDRRHALFYSGDGLFSPETLALARGCDLAIHEAFQLEPAIAGHGTVRQCLDFGRETGAATLALVHVQRDERRNRYQEIISLLEGGSELHVIMPESGDVLEL